METARKVLAAYTIYPLHIDKITENVYKINDGNKDYALKRSNLNSEHEINMWMHVYEQAYHQNLVSVLPVYLTKSKDLYTIHNQNLYYITPWLESAETRKNNQSLEQFYRMIGNIHAKTRQVQTISAADFKRPFRKYATYCDEVQEQLFGFVEQFEKNRYMSPMDLSVCTHYRDLELALKKMKKYIEQLVDIEAESFSWNYSLCHYNLRFDHMLKTRQMHLINWEQARYENASLDLAYFFKNETKRFDAANEDFIDMFNHYMNENELIKSELDLLVIYLLDPSPYISIVQKYKEHRSSESMINQTKLLQQAYRQILFGLKWSKYVEDEFETLPLDDLEG